MAQPRRTSRQHPRLLGGRTRRKMSCWNACTSSPSLSPLPTSEESPAAFPFGSSHSPHPARTSAASACVEGNQLSRPSPFWLIPPRFRACVQVLGVLPALGSFPFLVFGVPILRVLSRFASALPPSRFPGASQDVFAPACLLPSSYCRHHVVSSFLDWLGADS